MLRARPSTTVSWRLVTHLSCSQATLSTVADAIGLDERGTVKACQIHEGGAFERGSTCGIVTGGCLAIALAGESALASGDEAARASVFAQLQEYTSWFEQNFGSTLCRDLIDMSLMTPAGIAWYLFSGRAYTRCVRQAGPAVDHLIGCLEGPRQAPADVSGEACGGCCAPPVIRRLSDAAGADTAVLELVSAGLDGGTGLSGGLCGALSAALLVAGDRCGIDPGVVGVRRTFSTLIRNEYRQIRRSEEKGMWSFGCLIDDFNKEFGSLECRDIAGRFADEAELASFVESSDTCARAIDWCATRCSEITRGI
jgi:hypothetical protein